MVWFLFLLDVFFILNSYFDITIVIIIVARQVRQRERLGNIVMTCWSLTGKSSVLVLLMSQGK